MAKNATEKKQVFRQPAATNQFGPRLGVVISEQSVRLCLARGIGAKTTIIRVQSFPLESDNQAGPIEWINQATTIVIDFLQKQKRQRIPVNVGLLMRGVGFRRINLPDMPAAELSQAIAWEGNKLFPFDFSKCAVHYDIVGRIKNKSAANLDVNIIAADNEIINTLYSSFKSAGIKIGQVNFLPYHLSRLLLGHKGVKPDQRNLIIYLDGEQSLAVFVHNGYLEFFQQFVTQPKAAGEGQAGIANIDAIGEELTTFLDLYGAQDSTRLINSIFLCGKYGWGEDTAEFIGNRTGLPCIAAQAP
ncbi:MAG: pilus assembly protein PilM, partial [FCB group bacterium]|nr:pilus assembly protein PilM [FCB group bacterium]